MTDETPIVEEGRDCDGEYRKCRWRDEYGQLHRIGYPAYIEYRKNEDDEWVMVEERYYVDGKKSRDDGFFLTKWDNRSGRISFQASRTNGNGSCGPWNFPLNVSYLHDTELMRSKTISIKLCKKDDGYDRISYYEQYNYLPGKIEVIYQYWYIGTIVYQTREEWLAALPPIGEAK